MWFSQYGRLWDGPWFVVGDAVFTRNAAGIMLLVDLPAAMLTMEDRANGRINVTDR
jgi:hypothetical protein